MKEVIIRKPSYSNSCICLTMFYLIPASRSPYTLSEHQHRQNCCPTYKIKKAVQCSVRLEMFQFFLYYKQITVLDKMDLYTYSYRSAISTNNNCSMLLAKKNKVWMLQNRYVSWVTIH